MSFRVAVCLLVGALAADNCKPINGASGSSDMDQWCESNYADFIASGKAINTYHALSAKCNCTQTAGSDNTYNYWSISVTKTGATDEWCENQCTEELSKSSAVDVADYMSPRVHTFSARHCFFAPKCDCKASGFQGVAQYEYQCTQNMNIPNSSTDLQGCAAYPKENIRNDPAKRAVCEEECNKLSDCVAVVFHSYGTMLKKSLDGETERTNFETCIKQHNAMEATVDDGVRQRVLEEDKEVCDPKTVHV